VKECPFCPGNEHMTMAEVYRRGGGKSWQVRVVPNKFAALSIEGERNRDGEGFFRSMNGVGYHEVIIEHPRHDLILATMSQDDVVHILQTYLQRFTAIKQDTRIEAIILFKNHGEAAGSSIVHPHSQLAATPVVPFQFRGRLHESMRYFDEQGTCLFCRNMEDELQAGSRIVAETTHFVAFIPYGALSPFHMWVFPKRHSSSFDDITDDELHDMARILRSVLARLYFGLNNPDFNFSIRSIPVRDRNTDYYHWYLTIIPGSGMYINTSLPEESAAFLRDISLSQQHSDRSV
jgi:UDPglucose--hexose-1-phosphate uridylyltransferase